MGEEAYTPSTWVLEIEDSIWNFLGITPLTIDDARQSRLFSLYARILVDVDICLTSKILYQHSTC